MTKSFCPNCPKHVNEQLSKLYHAKLKQKTTQKSAQKSAQKSTYLKNGHPKIYYNHEPDVISVEDDIYMTSYREFKEPKMVKRDKVDKVAEIRKRTLILKQLQQKQLQQKQLQKQLQQQLQKQIQQKQSQQKQHRMKSQKFKNQNNVNKGIKIMNKHISRHNYYGINREEDANNPVEGDTFVNLLSGEWSIYRHGVWINIPTPGPRTYIGPNIIPDIAVPHPKEGSIYFDTEGRIYVYQETKWIQIPIGNKINLSTPQLENISSLTETFQPKNKIPITTSPSTHEKKEPENKNTNEKKEPENKNTNEKKEPENKNTNEKKEQEKKMETDATEETGDVMINNFEIEMKTYETVLQPSEVSIQINITTDEYYDNLIQKKNLLGIKKTASTVKKDCHEFRFIPKGEQDIVLSNLGDTFNYIQNTKPHNYVHISLTTWIQYTDNNDQSWQTYVAMCDPTAYDIEGKIFIGAVEVVPANLEKDTENLYRLRDDVNNHTYFLNLQGTHEYKLIIPPLNVDMPPIGQIQWKYVLIVNTKGKEPPFFIVNDFNVNELEQRLDDNLPLNKIMIR